MLPDINKSFCLFVRLTVVGRRWRSMFKNWLKGKVLSDTP